jgi:hypothetical protein
VRGRARGLLVVTLLAIGCGTTTQTPAPASPTIEPTTTFSPAASAAGGPLEIRGGDLAAVTDTHSGFEPRIMFDVEDGWQGVQNTRGFFDIQQDSDTPDVIAVQFGNVDAVYGAHGAAVETDARGAVRAIRLNKDLNVLDESPSLMSGLDGFTIEVENAAPNGVLAVMVGGSVARWDESLAAAEPVLESVRIGDKGG